jgi:hypothetical protein
MCAFYSLPWECYGSSRMSAPKFPRANGQPCFRAHAPTGQSHRHFGLRDSCQTHALWRSPPTCAAAYQVIMPIPRFKLLPHRTSNAKHGSGASSFAQAFRTTNQSIDFQSQCTAARYDWIVNSNFKVPRQSYCTQQACSDHSITEMHEFGPSSIPCGTRNVRLRAVSFHSRPKIDNLPGILQTSILG